MLILVSLFLATFVVAAFIIWLYRIFFGVQNYQGKTVAKRRSGNSMKLVGQQGYITLRRKPTKASRNFKVAPKMRSANGVNKVPWGW